MRPSPHYNPSQVRLSPHYNLSHPSFDNGESLDKCEKYERDFDNDDGGGDISERAGCGKRGQGGRAHLSPTAPDSKAI